MTPSDILTAAKDFISNPDDWYQGNFHSPDGKRSCALGAFGVTSFETPMRQRIMASDCLNRAARELGCNSVASLNDQTDHGTVMLMFDYAIKYALEDEL